MLLLGTLGLVWLCSIITVCECTVGENATCDCYRKTCVEKKHNITKTVCLHPEAGFSCCGEQAFNPATATCCKQNITAKVTEGLSEKVSRCCGLRAYDPLNELCCGETTIIARSGPNSKCCDQKVIDEETHLCCGKDGNKKILNRTSSNHQCCGPDLQYDTMSQRCKYAVTHFEIQPLNTSKSNSSAKVTEGLSQKVLRCCGLRAYDPLNELCCGETTIIARRGPNSKCCDQKVIDEETHLCCGSDGNKKILNRTSSNHQCCGPDLQYDTTSQRCNFVDSAHFEIQPLNTKLQCGLLNSKNNLTRNSSDHLCCGRDQFDKKTQCCCSLNGTLVVHPIEDKCCKKQSGVQQQKHGDSPNSTKAQRSLSGSSLKESSALGHGGASPTVHNQQIQICSHGRVSEWTPQAKQFNGSHRETRCGTEVNHTEICCDGHSHPKIGHMYCCGTRAYNFKNKQMKCCSGILYNLTLFGLSEQDVQCCGSVLKKRQDVCCLGEEKELLYAEKKGFRCCAHHYYNSSLWSCCAGRLNPRRHPNRRTEQNNSTLLAMDNLNEKHLCEKILIGIVASVSEYRHSIAFNNVLEIHGRNGTVTPLPSPHIVKTPASCNFPTVTPGKPYFFDQNNMYTDFNHDSILQSIHFILTKCFHHKAVAC